MNFGLAFYSILKIGTCNFFFCSYLGTISYGMHGLSDLYITYFETLYFIPFT